MPSKYNSLLFEDYFGKDLATKKRGFLASLSKYQIDTNKLLVHLVMYYSELHVNLERLLQGYYDSMFRRFIAKSKILFYKNKFENVCEIWEDVFSNALEKYLKNNHNSFSETHGISYVAYFDIFFSNALYYSFISHEDLLKDRTEEVRLTKNYLYEPCLYPLDRDLVSAYRSFSPLQITIH